MMKILLLNGHPDKESFCAALAQSYQKGAEKSEAQLSVVNLSDLQFNPNLQYGYRKRTELEPDLLEAIEKIKQADHLVWVFPMWWSGYPAMMKGFIDRVFLPGIAFDYAEGKSIPKKLFKGKSARIIVTGDSPKWYLTLFLRNPLINQFKRGTLQFCGVSPVKVTYISPIKHSSEQFRLQWLKKVEQLGFENR